MSRAQVQKGDVLTFQPVPSGGVKSGDGLLIADAFGVCQTDAEVGGEVEAAVEGVHALPKVAGAVAFGAAVYWNNTSKRATTTASGNVRIGFAAAPAAAGDAAVSVKLCPV